MNINKDKWSRVKIRLKRKYNRLTDSDLNFGEKDKEQLIATLSTRLRRSKEYINYTLERELAKEEL